MVCATLSGIRAMGIAMVDEAFDFEAFMRRCYPTVLAYLLSRTRNAALAQDLAQETFLQAYRSRSSYDPGRADALDWVLGIARHVSAYAARRQSARSRKMTLLESMAEKVWRDRERDAGGDERLEALRRCLETLPDRSRRIIELLYESGCTVAETARWMGMEVGAVKVAAHRARRALLECIRRRLAGEGAP